MNKKILVLFMVFVFLISASIALGNKKHNTKQMAMRMALNKFVITNGKYDVSPSEQNRDVFGEYYTPHKKKRNGKKYKSPPRQVETWSDMFSRWVSGLWNGIKRCFRGSSPHNEMHNFTE